MRSRTGRSVSGSARRPTPPTRAAASGSTSLAIAKRLAAADPSNSLWHSNLAEFLWKSGNVAEGQDKYDEARGYWKQALDVLSGMEQRGLHLSPEQRDVVAALRERLADDAAEGKAKSP